MTTKPSLEDQLLAAGLGLSEDDFATYCSDLYVRYQPNVMDWLRVNYESFDNVTTFRSNIDDELNIEIPFANEDYWIKRMREAQKPEETDVEPQR